MGESIVARSRVQGILVGLVIGFVCLAVTKMILLAICLMAVASALAISVLLNRKANREATDGELVPQMIDSIASALTAGTSLIESIDSLVDEGQPAIRKKAQSLLAIFESDSTLEVKVNQAKAVLNSQEGDLFLELLLIAGRRGDDQFVPALNTLSDSFRSQQALSKELKARQGWVMGTARLGLASPWLIVLLLSARPETAAAFESELGTVVLLVGLLLSFVAHRLIIAGSKLPRASRSLGPKSEANPDSSLPVALPRFQ